MQCRVKCGACCIAPSISSPLPGLPTGKAANVQCLHLDENMRCKIFDSPLRPKVCVNLQPSRDMCGNTRQDALIYLVQLEQETAPERR